MQPDQNEIITNIIELKKITEIGLIVAGKNGPGNFTDNSSITVRKLLIVLLLNSTWLIIGKSHFDWAIVSVISAVYEPREVHCGTALVRCSAITMKLADMV